MKKELRKYPRQEFQEGAFEGLETPDGRPFWTSPEMSPPLFTTAQVTKVFFARGVRWGYRYLLTYPHLSHPDVGTLETLRTKSQIPARRWRFYDVEVWAHILAAHGVIDGIHLANTVQLLKISARMWGHEL